MTGRGSLAVTSSALSTHRRGERDHHRRWFGIVAGLSVAICRSGLTNDPDPRARHPGVGDSEATLSNWLKAADVQAGVKPGVTSDVAAELKSLRSRAELLEQENEVLRRAAAYLSQANLKLGSSSK